MPYETVLLKNGTYVEYSLSGSGFLCSGNSEVGKYRLSNAISDFEMS